MVAAATTSSSAEPPRWGKQRPGSSISTRRLRLRLTSPRVRWMATHRLATIHSRMSARSGALPPTTRSTAATTRLRRLRPSRVAAATTMSFAGAGGNDTIIGNGNTRLNYAIALSAVSVDLETAAGSAITVAGSATSATEGTDTFTGVNAVQASTFNDTLLGSSFNNTFTGLGGDDYIDGRGGFDTASYNSLSTVTSGVAVNMVAGTATGDPS